MKTKSYLKVLLFFLLITACKNENPSVDNIFKFKEYINYTTSGVVSVEKNIIVNLAKQVPNWEEEKEISSDFFSITPRTSGKLIAKNQHTIEFIPTEPLKSNTVYSVTVKLNKIYTDIPSEFDQYTFEFKTITPNYTIQMENLQSYDKNYQFLAGTIKSADIISLSDAKKILQASQKDSKVAVVFNESFNKGTVFEFKIDSIKRYETDSELLIKWNGNAIKSSHLGESSFVIPGKNNFKLVSVSAQQREEQYVSINFSDPLQNNQIFDGLVAIEGVEKPTFVVDGNVLKVYYNSKLSGDFKVAVFEGIKNNEGYKLKTPFSETITFQQKKPEVRLISSGTILPNSKELKFNFEAVNLKAVDVRVVKIFEDNVLQFLQENDINNNYDYAIRRVGRRVAKQKITLIETEAQNTGKWKSYSVDLSKFFTADPGAIYNVEISFNKAYSLYDCDVTTKKITETTFENALVTTSFEDDELEEKYWDNQLYSYKNYDYNWQERDNPCSGSYYNDKEISQNLVASNIGVIVKKGEKDTYNFAVTDILSTQTIANAKIVLFNYQQQKIAESSTDKNGFATVNSDKTAAFAIVSKGKDITYVKLLEGNSLSFSKFDIDGSKTQKGLKGYLYGERGVWRPGDSLHLSFILNDKDNKLPENHPVKLEITNPNGKLIYQNIAFNSLNNFYKFTVETSPESSTGNYTAKVSVGGAEFYQNLKIETVKPNRLKMKIDFKETVLSYKKPINATLSVNWLHGAPAKNVKATVQAKFSSSNSGFKKYKDFVFVDPTRTLLSEEITVFDAKVDANGKATINNKLSIGNNAPGMINIQFLVKTFENGGNFSIDAFSKAYAPYATFVGLKSPEGNDYGSFYTDEKQTFTVATVDENGTPKATKKLRVKVYKIEWRWWWNSSSDNLSKYASSSYHKAYKEFDIATNSTGKTTFELNIPEKDKGRFLIRIEDTEGGHATGRTAYFYKNWWENEASADKDAAKMLIFSADKESYKVGETATITFPSGTNGNALISIENGTEVIEQQWVQTTKGKTEVNIPITAKMTPNVYINISLLQPHIATENDLPIRLYGTIPILVENGETKLEPQISLPKVIRPEQNFEVHISEKNNKSMTYTLAIVEEGLLDLTRFATPNPHNEFFAREALGVKTWDIFDDVIGAYSGSIDQVFAIGGDGNITTAKNKKANRFKPVVTYLGPFQLKKGGKATHKIHLPNYIGAVRTMVVAGNVDENSYGSAEKTAEVKKPLMVLATLPRKLSPGEKVTLPVSVFAMEDNIKDVSISLKLSNGISILGKKSQQLTFENPDEKMVYFSLDVSNAKGINTVEVLASGNGETASYKVEIDVENPNSISTKIVDIKLDPNKTIPFDFDTFGELGTNSASIVFSTIPYIDFSRRLQYLISYPHGCLEQTTSAVFPQLFMTDIFDVSADKKQEIKNNIEKGIEIISTFQKADGGLSYWLGENFTNDWATTFAGHFMLEAEKKGYVLPLTFKSNWIQHQKNAARNWRPSYNTSQTDLAQAYRLYSLALANTPDLSAMNRLREFTEISNEAKWRLAAAYALAGQKEASEQIMSTCTIHFNTKSNDYYTFGSVNRNRAMALETMVITENPNADELVKTIAKELSSDAWMSTQTTAFSLLAIAKMLEKNGGKEMDLSFTANKKTLAIKTNKTFVERALTVSNGKNQLSVKNNKDNVIYVRILNSGKLPLGKELSESRGLDVSITYKDLKGNKIDVSKLQQGEDFVASITVRNLKNETVNNVALTQIFPSGWEIVNTRYTDFGNSIKSDARYTDVRDDKVQFYFDLQSNAKKQEKAFEVLLNSAYLGTYYLPGTQVEAMYDNDFFVRTKGSWIEVVKE